MSLADAVGRGGVCCEKIDWLTEKYNILIEKYNKRTSFFVDFLFEEAYN